MEKCPKANRIKDRDRNEGGTRNDGGEGGRGEGGVKMAVNHQVSWLHVRKEEKYTLTFFIRHQVYFNVFFFFFISLVIFISINLTSFSSLFLSFFRSLFLSICIHLSLLRPSPSHSSMILYSLFLYSSFI